MTKILLITQDYVILYKKIPENESILSPDAVFPPFMKGDLVEWVDAPIPVEYPKILLWMPVKRLSDGITGFIKIIYLEHCIDIDNSGDVLSEVRITTKRIMDKVRIDKIIRLIEENIKHKYEYKKFNIIDILTDFLDFKLPLPLLPPLSFYFSANTDVILQLLYSVHHYHNIREFTYILLRIGKDNVLRILQNITEKDIEKYPETVIRLLFSLPIQEIYSLLLKQAKIQTKELVKTALKDKSRAIADVRVLVLKLEKKYKATKKDIEKYQDNYLKRIESFFSDFLKMRFYQLEYTMDSLEDNGVVNFLDEIDFFVDIVFEIFFATEIKNENLILICFFLQIDARDLIEVYSKLKKGVFADFDMPLLLLAKDGDINMNDINMRYVFDYERKVLKDTPKIVFSDPEKLLTQKETHNFVNIAFFRVADAIKTSFGTDWIKIVNSRPNLLPMLNKVIKNKYQKEAYAKLSESINGKFNEKTTFEDIDILNKINWIDLARIWHYQLGDLTLFGGEEGSTLKFGQDAFTTQSIIKHPGLKMVHEYASARINAENHKKFTISFKYGPQVFFAAVRDNDVMQNLLGSFAVKVEPPENTITTEIKYTIINQLHLESGTRFTEDHKGVIQDQKREEHSNKYSEQGGTYLALGGTLSCKWSFNLPIISKK
jgi:hypothetical protein